MRKLFMSVRYALTITVTMFCFFGAIHAQTSDTAATAANPSQCIMCHKDAASSLAMTKHGVIGDTQTPAGSGSGCESCHINAQEHLKNQKDFKPLTFKKSIDAHDRSEVCESCHKGKDQMHWIGSKHERSDVACNDCHKVHTAKDQVVVPETQAGVCFDCHKDIRASTMRASSHPVKTGEMSCSSCHEPHGSVGDASLIKATANETCYTCHAEMRGPFLWPHPPAVDDCSNCHNPHGSNNRPMLQARGPFLCQECHANANHPASVYSQLNLPPNSTAGDKILEKNCMSCHPKVHGSNHPSGARFTR